LQKVLPHDLPVSQDTSVADKRTDRQTDDNHANSLPTALLMYGRLKTIEWSPVHEMIRHS